MRPHLIMGFLILIIIAVLAVPTGRMERVTATQPLRVAHVDVSTVPVAAIPTADVSNWPAPDPFEGSSFVADEMGPQDVLLDAAAADAAPVGTDPVAEPVPVEWRQVGPPSITAGDVIANARSLLGVPYLWGGNTTAGMDCSAYVSRAWGVPRQTTDTLYLVAYPIAKEELLPGDVMNLTKSQDPRGYGHVRMFAAWANTDHSRVWVYEETPRQSIYHVIAYDSHYTPMRRENIVFDGQAAPLVPEPVSTPSAGTGSRPQPSATRTPTVTSSRVPGNVTPTTRATPSRTVTPTPTLGATLTPSATRTPLATRTPVPSAPTATPRSAPTLTPTATPKAYRPSPTPTPWKHAPRN